jgi:high-affinity K+ transport system ATPase subunit B
MSKASLISEHDAVKSVVVDLIFTFLPVFVLILIRILTSSWGNIFLRSDWSYISMILFGQSIIKIFIGISENSNKKKTVDIILYISLLIALGLVPSIIILVLIEMGAKHNALTIAQIIWLMIAIASYFTFGTLGNILFIQKLIKDSDFNNDKNDIVTNNDK